MRFKECEIVYRTRTVPGEHAMRAAGARVTSSERVYALLGPIASERACESLWAVMLDARSRIVAIHEVARGGLSSVHVEARDMFRAAVVANASAIILAHNHPSGDCNPSAADIAITEHACNAGELLGVKVLDHVIIGASGFYSMLDAGVLPFRTSPAR